MQLAEILENRLPFDNNEAAMQTEFLRFLRENSPLYGREVVGPAALQGHITATAWIVDITQTQILLTYHAKTAVWLPPGEHCDGNANVAEMALRIAQQVTGLPLMPLRSGIFDVNIRLIPEYWNTPEHRHYELCFAMQADAAAWPVAPARKMRWVALEEVHTLNADTALARLVAKTRRLLAAL